MAEFDASGVTVFESVLSDDEVASVRERFHAQLAPLLDSNVPQIGVRKKSPVSEIYYPSWKLFDVHLHARVHDCMQALMQHTYYNPRNTLFPAPFRTDSPCIWPYIDRVCYRLPDVVREEGGLGLHIDNHPNIDVGALKKWRPIQAFVALTDHFDATAGGLQVVRGFHKEYASYFSSFPNAEPAKGEFFRMHSLSHAAVQKRCQFVYAPRGSLVCWDYRLPHATGSKLAGTDTREVVYTGWLPDCALNRRYVQQQWRCIVNNVPPPAFDPLASLPHAGRDWSIETLSPPLGRLLQARN